MSQRRHPETALGRKLVQLRERRRWLPILVMSGGVDAQHWADDIGAAGCLNKPFEILDLVVRWHDDQSRYNWFRIHVVSHFHSRHHNRSRIRSRLNYSGRSDDLAKTLNVHHGASDAGHGSKTSSSQSRRR